MPEMDVNDFIKELAQFEIEFIDDGGNYCCFNSHIKRIYDDYIFISPPQKRGISYNIKDGQQIDIVFKTVKGVMSARSAVLNKQLDRVSGLNISFPYNNRFTERRSFVRTPINLNIEVIKFFDINHKRKELVHVQTRNISGSGLAYISNEPLVNYYDLNCKIYINDGKEPINVRCEHVYSKKVKINTQKAYLTALAYINISEEQISRIVKACFKYQVENRK